MRSRLPRAGSIRATKSGTRKENVIRSMPQRGAAGRREENMIGTRRSGQTRGKRDRHPARRADARKT
jgi:hypothetical protein